MPVDPTDAEPVLAILVGLLQPGDRIDPYDGVYARNRQILVVGSECQVQHEMLVDLNAVEFSVVAGIQNSQQVVVCEGHDQCFGVAETEVDDFFVWVADDRHLFVLRRVEHHNTVVAASVNELLAHEDSSAGVNRIHRVLRLDRLNMIVKTCNSPFLFRLCLLLFCYLRSFGASILRLTLSALLLYELLPLYHQQFSFLILTNYWPRFEFGQLNSWAFLNVYNRMWIRQLITILLVVSIIAHDHCRLLVEELVKGTTKQTSLVEKITE